MIWTTLLRFLRDPRVLVIIGLTSVIIFMKFEIWSLERDLEKADILNSKLELRLDTSTSNLHKAVLVNDINEISMKECILNTDKLNGSYVIIVENKEKLISKLRATISELSKPVIYPETIIYKECVVKIKSQGAVNETDITFNSISNIGH